MGEPDKTVLDLDLQTSEEADEAHMRQKMKQRKAQCFIPVFYPGRLNSVILFLRNGKNDRV